MTKTFKITIGILILLALAAGGVLGVSRSKRPSSALTGQGTPSSAPSARFGGQASDKEEGQGNNEISNNESRKAELEQLSKEVEEFRNKTVESVEWKTYKNEEYGFELKYPVDWEVKLGYQENNLKSFYLISEWRKELFEKYPDLTWLRVFDASVTIYNSLENLYENLNDKYSLQDWVKIKAKWFEQDKIKEKKIDGNKMYYGPAIGDGPFYVFYVENNGKIYEITIDNENLSPIEQFIIDNFRFLP